MSSIELNPAPLSRSVTPDVSRTRVHATYVWDWATLAGLALIYALLEDAKPFHRLFRLDDHSIQYPMAEHERVPNSLCIALAVILPSIIVVVSPLVLPRRKNRLHLIHMSLLGLATAFVINGVFVDTVKVWIGNPRPDFLSRCQPAKGTPKDKLVGIEVCTNTNMDVLLEGLKSTPSGHSSTSFSGLFYLSLWIAGQLQALRPRAKLYKFFLSFSPLMLATYIAISRTEDYRHHFYDVISGTIIGLLNAWFCYRRHFPSLSSAQCHSAHSSVTESPTRATFAPEDMV